MSQAPVRLVVRSGNEVLGGVVGPEESWLAAARRTCSVGSGWPCVEPVAVDLAGAIKVFEVEPAVHVELLPMTGEDLARVVGWRSDPVVQRWWSPGEISSDAEISNAYAERIAGLTPVTMWIIVADHQPIGFVQDYRIGDYPDDGSLSAGAGPGPDDIGVDYAIGEPRARGRGLGVRILWTWALRTRVRRPAATTYFAGPDHRNGASLRILTKAGFVPGQLFEEHLRDGRVDTVVGCRFDAAKVLGAPAASA